MERIKGKRILIHALTFPPDQVSTSYLYGDIVQKLISSGFEVEVITTYPHYNYFENFSNYATGSFYWKTSNYFGAKVHHAPQKKSKSIAIRATYLLFFHIVFIFKAIFIRKFDIILTPSPPITSGFLSGLVAKLRGAKSIYNVQEIYPDVLIKQANIKKGLVFYFLKLIERFTYKMSDRVVTIDEHFSKIIENRLPKEKLLIIPNFIDTELYKPYYGECSANLKLDNKFLVGYVGNLGKVQNWDMILESIGLLKNNLNVHFLLVGGGSEYDYLKSAEKELQNLTVMPYQNRELIPMINSRINLHFIAMTEASDMDGLPSKVYAILSSGRPILASTSSNSPLANVVQKSGNGVVIDLGNSKAFADKIIEIYNGGLFSDETNRTAREFVLNGYSKEVVTGKYVELVDGLLLL